MRQADEATAAPVLFLDFESILLSSVDPGVKPLFERVIEQMPYLGPLLERYPNLRLVLSTPHLSVPATADLAATEPEPNPIAQNKELGASEFRSVDTLAALASADPGFAVLPRYQQIMRYAQHHHLTHWLAVDDDAVGWPDAARPRLIRVDSDAGLTDPLKQVELRAKLNRLFDGL